MSMWRQTQRLECWVCKQRSAKDYRWAPESPEKVRTGPLLEPLEGAWLSQHLDVRLAASSTGRQCVSIVVSHLVCGDCHNSSGTLKLSLWCLWLLRWIPCLPMTLYSVNSLSQESSEPSSRRQWRNQSGQWHQHQQVSFPGSRKGWPDKRFLLQ